MFSLDYWERLPSLGSKLVRDYSELISLRPRWTSESSLASASKIATEVCWMLRESTFCIKRLRFVANYGVSCSCVVWALNVEKRVRGAGLIWRLSNTDFSDWSSRWITLVGRSYTGYNGAVSESDEIRLMSSDVSHVIRVLICWGATSSKKLEHNGSLTSSSEESSAFSSTFTWESSYTSDLSDDKWLVSAN